MNKSSFAAFRRFTLYAGVAALQKSERSWMVGVGLPLALLVGAIWILLIAAQFAISH